MMGKYSNYKGVSYSAKLGLKKWVTSYKNKTSDYVWSKFCLTEREAAISYDIKMIELGKAPVNILKHKS